MNKTPDNREPQRLDVASRVGMFDVAIHKTYIVAKPGEGFTIHYPYGIIGIKSDSASIAEFVGLLKKFELDISSDESVMDCHVDPTTLNGGGAVVWEAPRYSMKTNHITLWEWLSKNGIVAKEIEKPDNVVEFGTHQRIRDVIEGTGTYGGL